MNFRLSRGWNYTYALIPPRIFSMTTYPTPYREKSYLWRIGYSEYREDTRQKTPVRIRVDKMVAQFIKGAKDYYGFVAERIVEDQVEMTFRVADPEHGFPR